MKKSLQINNLRSREELHIVRSLYFRVRMLMMQDESDILELVKYVIPDRTPDVQQAVVIGLAPIRVEDNVSV